MLAPDGRFAFSVETHDGDGVLLRDTLRYAHGAAHVRGGAGGSGIETRQPRNPPRHAPKKAHPVPGLIVVADATDIWNLRMTDSIPTPALLPDVFARWFASRGWAPRAHQLELLAKAQGRPLGAADRADRRRQDAGRLPADAGRAERARLRPRNLKSTGRALARHRACTRYISRR